MNEVIEKPNVSKMLAKGHKEFGIAELPSNEEAAIALRAKYSNLPPATTREGYERHRIAQGELTKIRTSIEKRRKEIKAEFIEKGRAVDAFAKHWTAVIEEIEEPIRAAKALVDEAKERERKAKEEAERLRLEEEARQRVAAEEAKLRAEREAEEARLKAIRDAEAERIRVENERLAIERAAMEAERAEQTRLANEQRAAVEAEYKAQQDRLRAEREAFEAKQREALRKIDAENARLEAERQRLERLEELKRINERARQEALERVERERIEAEQKAAAKAKADKEEEARLAAMRSDAEKVHDYAKFFAGFLAPPVGLKSKAAVGACREAYEAVIAAGKKLQEFKAR